MKISARAGNRVMEVGIDRRDGTYVVEIDGVRHEVDVHKLEGDFFSMLMAGRSYEVSVEAQDGGYVVRHGAAALRVDFFDPSRGARDSLGAVEGPERVVSMMPGKVVRLLVAEGDAVEAGQGVVVVEAMKMENEIAASKAGTVGRIHVGEGQTVEGGAVLLVID